MCVYVYPCRMVFQDKWYSYDFLEISVYFPLPPIVLLSYMFIIWNRVLALVVIFGIQPVKDQRTRPGSINAYTSILCCAFLMARWCFHPPSRNFVEIPRRSYCTCTAGRLHVCPAELHQVQTCVRYLHTFAVTCTQHTFQRRFSILLLLL